MSAPVELSAAIRRLRPRTAAPSAVISLAAAMGHQIVAQAALADTARSPEPMHELRIAIRRLRTLLWAAAALLPDAHVRNWREQLEAVAGLAGATRDWDVLLDTLLPKMARAQGADLNHDAGGSGPSAAGAAESAVETLLRAAQRRRRRARAASRQALREAAVPALVRDCLRELRSAGKSARAAAAVPTIGEFARQAIEHAERTVRRRARKAMHGDVRQLHRTRIAIKRLRYLIECFAPLLAPRDTRRYDELLEWQKRLGKLNDMVAARAQVPHALADEPALNDALTVFDDWLGKGIRRRRRKAMRKIAALH